MLNKLLKLIDPKFKKYRKSYLVQSLAAFAFILCFLALSHQFVNGLMVFSMAASTFITFAFPQANATHPRFMIGSYILACILGLCFYYLNLYMVQYEITIFTIELSIIICAVNYFFMMFLMVLLNLEHPPASALSLSLVVAGNPLSSVMMALTGIILLCGIKYIFRNHLINLS